MALSSYLFRGDAKLDAASKTASAHITRGSRGDHVAKLQHALARLTGDPLVFDGQYGPKTAASVLEFKKKYNIINPTYQSQPDDIVGIMTIRELDEQILAIENSSRSRRHVRSCNCNIVRQG